MQESKPKRAAVSDDETVSHARTSPSKSKAEIAVLIVCALITASATITAAYFATRKQKQTTIEVRKVSTLGLDDFRKYFPLQVGNEWIYEGVVRKISEDKSIIERNVLVRMKVVEAITMKENTAVTLFVMSGHPTDAMGLRDVDATSAEVVEPPPSHYAFLTIGNKVFEIYEVEAVKEFVQAGGFNGTFKLTQEQLVFEFPLFKGQRFGDSESLARADMRYLWYVNDIRQYDEPNDNKISQQLEYQIIRNNLPDSESVLFRPYLGIVEFDYVHHGPTHEVHIGLKDYHLNPQ